MKSSALQARRRSAATSTDDPGVVAGHQVSPVPGVQFVDGIEHRLADLDERRPIFCARQFSNVPEETSPR
jgi:hypothetical protein